MRHKRIFAFLIFVVLWPFTTYGGGGEFIASMIGIDLSTAQFIGLLGSAALSGFVYFLPKR